MEIKLQALLISVLCDMSGIMHTPAILTTAEIVGCSG